MEETKSATPWMALLFGLAQRIQTRQTIIVSSITIFIIRKPHYLENKPKEFLIEVDLLVTFHGGFAQYCFFALCE